MASASGLGPGGGAVSGGGASSVTRPVYRRDRGAQRTSIAVCWRPAVPSTSPSLSLGVLHRTLTELVTPANRAAIRLHFDQRSATLRDDATSAPPELLLTRRFDAELLTRDGGLMRAYLRSGSRSRRPAAWLSLVRVGDAYAYTVDGARFGRLDDRPELFDLARFQRKLDGIRVADVTVEETPRDGGSLVVLDADLDVAAFRRLVTLFAHDLAGDETDLRSYSVSLSSGRDVALDYWWSLAPRERLDGDTYRQSIACHVQVTVTGAPAGDDVSAVPEPTMPTVHHIDDVWQLARAARGAGA
jgi:hypothetical protein